MKMFFYLFLFYFWTIVDNPKSDTNKLSFILCFLPKSLVNNWLWWQFGKMRLVCSLKNQVLKNIVIFDEKMILFLAKIWKIRSICRIFCEMNRIMITKKILISKNGFSSPKTFLPPFFVFQSNEEFGKMREGIFVAIWFYFDILFIQQ